MPTTLFICLQCGQTERDENGDKIRNPVAIQLAETLTQQLAGAPITVQLTRCLSLCDDPIAWGLRNESGFAYTFAPATTAEDLATTARLYLETLPGKKLLKKNLPEATRPTLRSKLPPLTE